MLTIVNSSQKITTTLFQVGMALFPSKMLHDKPLSTLRYWRHVGYGPKSFKLGGRVVYKLEDVEQWIEAQYNDDTAGQRAG